VRRRRFRSIGLPALSDADAHEAITTFTQEAPGLTGPPTPAVSTP
jgi:hypothetical protein